MRRGYVQTTGAARDHLRAEAVRAYTAGASIRDVAAAIGRSYGTAHRLLHEGGVELRGRGHRQREVKR